MKRFRWSYFASLALTLALLGSMFLGNPAVNAQSAGPQPSAPTPPPPATVIVTNPAGYSTGLYSTIQAAINAANPGDTVNVWPGTYVEQITINKAITLRG